MKAFLKEMVDRYGRHSISQSAGQIAYFGFLSLFPFIVFMNFVIQKLHLSMGDVMGVLSPVLPEEILGFLGAYAQYISKENSVGILSLGIITTIYLMSAVIRSMETAVSKAYGIKKRRTFFKSILVSGISMVCIVIMIVAATFFIVMSKKPVRHIMEVFGLNDMVGSVLFIKWAFVIFLMIMVFAVVYKLVPNIKTTFKSVVPGTIFSVVGFVIISMGFGLYVSFAMAASSIYGYIGTVFVLLIWIYAVSVIFILGAEINGYFDGEKKS